MFSQTFKSSILKRDKLNVLQKIWKKNILKVTPSSDFSQGHNSEVLSFTVKNYDIPVHKNVSAQ